MNKTYTYSKVLFVFVLVVYGIFARPQTLSAQECPANRVIDVFECTSPNFGQCSEPKFLRQETRACWVNGASQCNTTFNVCSSNDTCYLQGGSCLCTASPADCSTGGNDGGGGGCADGYTMVHECRQECTSGWTGSDNCTEECGGNNPVCCKKCIYVPSCSVILNPTTLTLNVGTVTTFTSNVTTSDTISYVRYESSNVSRMTIPTGNTKTPPTFPRNAQAVSAGSVTITTSVYLNGQTTPSCADTTNVTITDDPPSCTVNISPVHRNAAIGEANLGYNAQIVPANGTIDVVNFSSTNTSVATVNPATDSVPSPYRTVVNALSAGNSTIQADVVMGGQVRCSDTSTITVSQTPPTSPWWQIRDGDVISTEGDIDSNVPTGSYFIDVGSGNFPGIATYLTSLNFASGLSIYNWSAKTQTNFVNFNYDYFDSLLPDDSQITLITTPTVEGDYFESGGTLIDGYRYYKFDGQSGSTAGQDLTIQNSDTVLLGLRKVVLLVKGANLYINRNILVNIDGSGFFAAFVGKNSSGTKGNIIIGNALPARAAAELEGIYFAEGLFQTGESSEQLHVRGSVVGLDGVILERNLSDNSSAAELFEFAPDLIANFPARFSLKKTKWAEISP